MSLVIIIVVLVSLGSIWFYPSVQAFMASNTMWNGINKFDNEFNVQNIDSLTALPDLPQKDVLISIPYLDYTPDQLTQMEQFVENGGKLILMDDFGYGNSFLEYAGIPARFDNIPLLDPLFNYKNEYFPRILTFDSSITVSGIKVIVFDHGTALSGVSQSQALAWSSNMSFLDNNKDGNLDNGETNGPFVVAADYGLGKGTIDLVSGPSLIMNAVPGTNDNSAFITYLINSNGTPDNILFDRSNMPNAPLDTAKIALANLRKIMSEPYILLSTIALVFVIITWYTYRRGLLIG
jgi:uncharacterized membrane protein